MISVNNLSFYFGSRPLYDGANLHIKPKDKIGLIGANGTGKSTLLKLLVGEYQPDAGSISKSGSTSIGFLNQDLLSFQSDESILKVAMMAFERENFLQAEIDKVLTKMETDYEEKDIDKLAKLQDEFEGLGGYTIQSRSEEILEGLGFTTEELQRPLRLFSGGWRMRVMLAKLLLQKPSLLMLDEPTNHLDLPSIQWVEKYINDYEGAIIVVSHDRFFLDNTVNTIAEVSGAKINVYSGNYTFYLEEKELRDEIQRGAYENQQSAIKQTERFIERFKAKATKARQVQSRVKALNRLELIDEVAGEAAKVNFKFNFGIQPGRFIMNLEDLSKAYGEKVILKNTTISIERGDKIALIGANGKGKSTLLRIIDGSENIEGSRTLGHNVIDSFYAQHQLESLNINNTLVEELAQAGSAKTEMELRGILGCFLFSGEEVFKKIKVLSGGEKSRVALAKVLISEANFLLLDEPTNHLDMVSVNILIQALQQYEGTYVVVSHDRYFVSEIANKIWYIEDYEIKQFPGTFDEYEVWMEDRKAAGHKEKETPKIVVSEKKVEKIETKAPVNTQEIKKLNKKIAELEVSISEIESKIQNVENQLADPAIFNDTKALEQTNNEYKKVKEQLEIANKSWEVAVTELEKLEA
ncbi:MAG: ABC-F family ATP-binding cassette domain-containing protein [Pseudarcicella sp.]|nr:ABC-F family ATP-binding cassette domain-containing protein [Pseudarcicella sp.]MBP6410973.1 ABC-F family ATP-binding cassette domain-containing protein [Pseudarcicella sp.]